MMGHVVHDPEGLEGRPGKSQGLKLLPVETILKAPKTTTRSRFVWQDIEGTGYEIHRGKTRRLDGEPLFQVFERNRITCETEDGCTLHASRIMGTYMHGLFDTPGITKRWLNIVGLGKIALPDPYGPAGKDTAYDHLAAHFEKNIDVSEIVKLLP